MAKLNGYQKDINLNIIKVDGIAVQRFFNATGVAFDQTMDTSGGSHPYEVTYDYDSFPTDHYVSADNNNMKVYINSLGFTLRNVDPNVRNYNLYDVIAAAKAGGVSDDVIASALSVAAINNPNHPTSSKRWTTEDVKQLSYSTTSTVNRVKEYIDEHYPGVARVETHLDPGGKKYKYVIKYTNPNTGAVETFSLDDLATNASEADVAAKLNPTTTYGSQLNAGAQYIKKRGNDLANADKQEQLANTVIGKLKNGDWKPSADAHQTLTDEELKAITAELPDTDNLKIWNQTKDKGIFDSLLSNFKTTNPAVLNLLASADPKVLKTLGLTPEDVTKLLENPNPDLVERLDLKTLEGISDAVTEEQQSIIQRNISKQKTDVLKAIAEDPELYNKITQQARADNAAGTIVGQRAANAQAIANEANAGYDKQASDLYSKLFGGENGNVAQQMYSTVSGDKAGTLDQYIQGKLDATGATVAGEASNVATLGTLLSALGVADQVDASRLLDAIAERQADATTKADKLINDKKFDAQGQATADQVYLDVVDKALGEGASWLSKGDASGVDVSKPTVSLDDFLKGLSRKDYYLDYGKVDPGAYKFLDKETIDKFSNAQYEALASDPEFIKFLLADETIDAFTKAQTIDEFKHTYGLDALSQAGLNELYGKYNTEATQEANKVFNAAQRAYIAAITAGDTKTADQLTKLASTAGASKGNLYAASALANQFKQQAGDNGSQLATDFLNQQAFNRSNTANVKKQADAALGKYLGNGNDSFDAATLYGIFNKDKQNKANAYNYYGELGKTLMGSHQDMYSGVIKHNIDNNTLLGQIANGVTAINANTANSNAINKGNADTIYAGATALKQGAQSTRDAYKK